MPSQRLERPTGVPVSLQQFSFKPHFSQPALHEANVLLRLTGDLASNSILIPSVPAAAVARHPGCRESPGTAGTREHGVTQR